MSDVRKHDPIQGDIVHEYDGIEEADNALPLWWLATFFFTVAFGFVYMRIAPSSREEYAEEVASRVGDSAEMTDALLATLAQDPTTVGAGRATFVANCVVCHGDRAQGDIGPNLTDDHWLHGGAPTSIYATVRDGVGARGMPQWGPVLGNRGVQSVAAYVITLRDTNESGGRPPEGDVYDPSSAPPEMSGPTASADPTH